MWLHCAGKSPFKVYLSLKQENSDIFVNTDTILECSFLIREFQIMFSGMIAPHFVTCNLTNGESFHCDESSKTEEEMIIVQGLHHVFSIETHFL